MKKKIESIKFQWWEDKDFMEAITNDAIEIKERKQKTFSLHEVKKGIEAVRKIL